jgi:hypothetical protein
MPNPYHRTVTAPHHDVPGKVRNSPAPAPQYWLQLAADRNTDPSSHSVLSNKRLTKRNRKLVFHIYTFSVAALQHGAGTYLARPRRRLGQTGASWGATDAHSFYVC